MAALPPSLEGDPNRANELLIITWVWCSLSLIVVALRLYSRVWLTRNLWWDDWVMFFTMALTLVFSVYFTLYAVKGGARHVVDLSSAQLEETTMINWVSQTFAIMAIGTGKVSVAILMGRLISPSTWRKWVLYFLAISALTASCLVIIFIFAQCSPPKTLWIPSAGHCWDLKKTNHLDVALASWSAFVDFALAMFGMTMIWNLQMNKRKKAGLSALLGLGVFAAICAAVKTSYIRTLTSHSDFTWITVDLLIWNALEVNVIILAACIPTIRPVVLQLSSTIHISVSIIRKSHSKLSSSRDGQSQSQHELQTIPPAQTHHHHLRPSLNNNNNTTTQNMNHHSHSQNHHDSPSPSSYASFQNFNFNNTFENNSQANIVTPPPNRILEVKEMDIVRSEERHERGRDEEYGWNVSGRSKGVDARDVL